MKELLEQNKLEKTSTDTAEIVDVFLSIGKTSSPEQEAFISAVEAYLLANGLRPRAIGRSDFASIQPLRFIEQVMKECSGTVVLGYERLVIEKGIEHRSHQESKGIANQKLTSVWNQVEAGMAYVLGHPLMVILEKGVKNEGILEFGYDWYVQSVVISPEVTQNREFQGVFADWKNRVIANYEGKNIT